VTRWTSPCLNRRWPRGARLARQTRRLHGARARGRPAGSHGAASGLAAGVLVIGPGRTPDDRPAQARELCGAAVALAGGVLAVVVAVHDVGQGVQDAW
jgi:hypothetical protein